MENEVTIRIGGESGEGTISGGDILALAAARWGYHVYTFRTFPAEILGGPCLFQVRISASPVKSMGDYADVLICLNQEAYERSIKDLRHGGVVIYDPSDLLQRPASTSLMRSRLMILHAKRSSSSRRKIW
jgi:2-oxoglutarate ferredoxin oxidoreductase subunit alpha